MSVAGGQYHEQAQALLGQEDGQVLIASTTEPHSGAFEKVVFVVDNMALPLYDILSAGLEAAEEAGLVSVTVPAMRLGVLLNAGGSPESKLADMVRAVNEFRGKARSMRLISFVIFRDPDTFEALRNGFPSPSDISPW